MSTGGSIESVTLDGRTFSVSADSDSERKLGGFNNEVQPNGDGTTRTIKTRVPWHVSGLAVDCDDQNNDQEFLQALVDGNRDFPITVTYADGSIYQGTGQIVSDTGKSSTSNTQSIDLMGGGGLTRQ